jgi:hypothetical protein
MEAEEEEEEEGDELLFSPALDTPMATVAVVLLTRRPRPRMSDEVIVEVCILEL